MPDKSRLPQIPTTVWWGVRSILQKTPGATIDERLLGVELDVQPTAAKQYVVELRAAGILNEDNKATAVAKKWRLDDTYPEAVQELIQIYPEGLRQVAPSDEGDRSKAKSWFMQEGLGEGAAGNKAATYFLIGSQQPNDSPARSAVLRQADPPRKSSQPAGVKRPGPSASSGSKTQAKGPQGVAPPSKDSMPLNVNVQIHISADAGTEQIEAIFSAMRRYLNDQQGS